MLKRNRALEYYLFTAALIVTSMGLALCLSMDYDHYSVAGQFALRERPQRKDFHASGERIGDARQQQDVR